MSPVNRLIPLSVELPIALVVLAVIASSMAVVYSKYLWRTEFVELQKLEYTRDKMDEEWGRLLLEQSTLASPGRVERQSRLRLNMIVPTADMTVVIKP
ncbi:cell division protein FtsL [Pseudomonadota bacterium]|nr:cell division protein FtsL [Pseudomonadota bacterium]